MAVPWRRPAPPHGLCWDLCLLPAAWRRRSGSQGMSQHSSSLGWPPSHLLWTLWLHALPWCWVTGTWMCNPPFNVHLKNYVVETSFNMFYYSLFSSLPPHNIGYLHRHRLLLPRGYRYIDSYSYPCMCCVRSLHGCRESMRRKRRRGRVYFWGAQIDRPRRSLGGHSPHYVPAWAEASCPSKLWVFHSERTGDFPWAGQHLLCALNEAHCHPGTVEQGCEGMMLTHVGTPWHPKASFPPRPRTEGDGVGGTNVFIDWEPTFLTSIICMHVDGSKLRVCMVVVGARVCGGGWGVCACACVRACFWVLSLLKSRRMPF